MSYRSSSRALLLVFDGHLVADCERRASRGKHNWPTRVCLGDGVSNAAVADAALCGARPVVGSVPVGKGKQDRG